MKEGTFFPVDFFQWKSVRLIPDCLNSSPKEWRFFTGLDQPSKELLRVWASPNDPSFADSDEAITDLMVRKTLRVARWRHRLTLWRYVGSAIRRRFYLWYGQHVYPRYALLVRRFTRVAETEKTAQESEKAGNE